MVLTGDTVTYLVHGNSTSCSSHLWLDDSLLDCVVSHFLIKFGHYFVFLELPAMVDGDPFGVSLGRKTLRLGEYSDEEEPQQAPQPAPKAGPQMLQDTKAKAAEALAALPLHLQPSLASIIQCFCVVFIFGFRPQP